ncbi:MAG: Gfo/Idh/MocA family protein [Candidatus Eiseniibacteriota bacterium]
MAKRPLRLGVIGVGVVAQVNHLPALKGRRDVEVVAISDDDVEKARMVAQHFGIGRSVADYEALLRMDEIDAVIIATPNHLHAPMTQAALGYGKHVLCEKPPARTLAEASQMADAAQKSGKVLMYAMNNRFRSDVAVLRRYLEREELGRILYAKTGWLRRRAERRGPGWYENKKSSGGGVLMDLGVQMLDLSLWLLGNPKVASVTAAKYMTDPRKDVEDTVAAFLVLEGGASLTLEVSWAVLLEKNFPYLNLFGTDGAALLNPFRIHKELNGTLLNVTPALESPKNIYKQSYEQELDHFLRCITHGETPMASAEEGREIMRIIDAIYQSAEARREVRLH